MPIKKMINFKNLFWLLACFSLSVNTLAVEVPSDSFTMPVLQEPMVPRDLPYLEYNYAQMRAQQIKNVHYDLSFILDANSTDYTASVAIKFSLADNNISPLRLDFDGGEIKSMTLNGHAVEWQQKPWFVLIPANQLASGKNQLDIQFTHPFSTAGDGLHRYKDQQTGNVYLYSNFEPFNAHKMFPHFDQPNLKAIFKLNVIAPANWILISTELESSKRNKGKQTEWKFPPTPPISSYVFSLHAGPYKVWEDKLGKMPLRLLARKELAPYVDYKEWLKVTKQSFMFYNNYFGVNYPFKKYDQLIVPDFNSGAMENVGAVTFHEHYAPRSKKLWLDRLRTASVISHEMAHMWFGDLVTMDWWNGLWLNESFATYMSALQQSENSDYKTASWEEFYLQMKQWGYQDDQKVTTHPIELPVNNTEEAFTNFDGITYGKGAAVLRQLAHYVGEENFRAGVHQYLTKNAYGNATLKDFIGAIESASGKDLTQWSQTWLYSASLNSVTAHFECSKNTDKPIITQFNLLQTGSEQFPQLRTHKMDLGLFQLQDGKMVAQTIPVEISAANTSVDAAINQACPDSVYPNVNDWDYIKVSLDAQSRQFLNQHINEFDKSVKLMLWQSLWDDVLDAKMSMTDFIHFVDVNLPNEKSDKQISINMEKIITASFYLQKMQLSSGSSIESLKRIEAILLQRFEAAEPGSDMQRGIFNLYLSVVQSQEGLAKVRAILLGEQIVKGLVLDQDLRWRVLISLNHYSFGDYVSLTQNESAKDASDFGQQMAILCEVIRADLLTKEKWFNEILSPQSTLKFATQRMVLNNLFPADQLPLRQSFESKAVAALPDLVKRTSDRFMAAYARSSLLPGNCTSESIQDLIKVRDTYSNLSPTLKKVLSVNVQEEERCLAMKKLITK